MYITCARCVAKLRLIEHENYSDTRPFANCRKNDARPNGFSDAPVFRGLDIPVSRAIKLSSSPFVLRDNTQ